MSKKKKAAQRKKSANAASRLYGKTTPTRNPKGKTTIRPWKVAPALGRVGVKIKKTF